MRLDQLTPQLATLDPATPAASEIRKLVGEQLPDPGQVRVTRHDQLPSP